MQNQSKLQKLEVYFVAALAVAVMLGFAFAVSSPFSSDAYGVSDKSVTTSRITSPAASTPSETPPAVLDPALRSLDGVSYHG